MDLYLDKIHKMNLKKLLFLALVIGLFTSCSKEDPIVSIEQFIEDNNLDAQMTPEGLYYVIDKEGTGQRPTSTDDVLAQYRGTLLNGTVFDSRWGDDPSNAVEFNLQRVIPGWTIGIPLFKEGGEGMLIIPPNLGYGDFPPPGSIIGRNEVLIFEVRLFEVR